MPATEVAPGFAKPACAGFSQGVFPKFHPDAAVASLTNDIDRFERSSQVPVRALVLARCPITRGRATAESKGLPFLALGSRGTQNANDVSPERFPTREDTIDPGLYDQVVKALAHRPRLLAIVRGDFLPPASVKIELTSVCNQGCHFCAYRRLTKDGPATFLETSRVLRLIDELAAHGTEGVMFTGGGEPLAHPEFASILAQCSRSGMQAALLTNGALLGKIGDEALRALRGLRFSINAGTAAEYAQVHQTSDSDWTRVWEQVVRVSDKSRFPRLSVGVSFVVTSRNVGSIVQLGQRAKQSGADYVHVRPAFIGPHTVLERTLSSEETATSLTQIEALQTLEDERFRVHGIVRRFHELEPARRRRSHCRATPLVAYVLPGGEVTLCTLVRERGFMPGLDDPFLGSLREASFFDLWNTPRHHDLIGRLSQAGCERCHFDQYNRALELVESDAIHAAFL